MAQGKKVIPPNLGKNKTLIDKKVKSPYAYGNLIVDFSKFKLTPICLRGKFNNHFKDNQHFCSVAAGFLGTVLPKITSHTYGEVCEGSSEGRILHFHTIDDSHRKTVREILEEYNFSKQTIDQMFEGKNIFDFSATLGHTYAARIICHKVDNVLHLLFLDTNHHVYMNEKYVGDSLFYEDCPTYISGNCTYMPGDCFAVSFLDEEKVKEALGYTNSPQ